MSWSRALSFILRIKSTDEEKLNSSLLNGGCGWFKQVTQDILHPPTAICLA